MSDISSLLKSLPGFGELEDGLLAAFAEAADSQSIGAGVTLHRAGERLERLHILKSGLVSLTSGDDGHVATIEFVRPVGFLSAPAALLDRPCIASAHTTVTSEFVTVPAANLRRLAEAEPRLAAALLAALSRQCRAFMRQVAGLKRRSATRRLGCYILELAKQQGGTAVVLPCEKRVLSSFLGMTPEHLSRAFNTLRRHGARTGHGRTVEITDRARLELYASLDDVFDDEPSGTAKAPAAAEASAMPRPILRGNDLPRPAAPAWGAADRAALLR
jgi:CRP/FNR family transcriptional regulator, transcriptional activator FtrB